MTDNKTDKPSARRSIAEIIEDTQDEEEAKSLVESIRLLIPILKQYNADLQTGQNNIINERLGMENLAQWCFKMCSHIDENFTTLTNKVEELKKYVDTSISEISDTLEVKVTVSDADYKTIDEKHQHRVKQITELHDKHEKKICDLFAKDSAEQIDRHYRWRNDLNYDLNRSSGLYLYGAWNWVGGIFFWIGVATVAGLICWGIIFFLK